MSALPGPVTSAATSPHFSSAHAQSLHVTTATTSRKRARNATDSGDCVGVSQVGGRRRGVASVEQASHGTSGCVAVERPSRQTFDPGG